MASLERADSVVGVSQLIDDRKKRFSGDRRNQIVLVIFNQSDQRRNAGAALSGDNAELRQMASQRIDQHCSLADQKLSCSVQNQNHHHAQAFRVDENRFGHKVYQTLADYQDRKHLLEGKTLRKDMVVGLGDGWLRLMTFDISKATPIIHVRTYSSYYRSYSTDTKGYASWYREEEQPELTDDQFMKADDFDIDLSDFKNRFRLMN